MNAFKVGNVVRIKYDEYPGEITDIDPIKKRVHIKFKRSSDWVDMDEVTLVDEKVDKLLAEQIQAKLDETVNSFASAFDAYEKAKDLARERFSSLRTLEDMDLINLLPLKQVMDNNGWSSSSLDC